LYICVEIIFFPLSVFRSFSPFLPVRLLPHGGADAAVLVTEWPQFLEIPWKQMGALMKTKFLIDTKNHFSKTQGLEDFEKVVPGKPVAKS
jgi:hypothetical protein